MRANRAAANYREVCRGSRITHARGGAFLPVLRRLTMSLLIDGYNLLHATDVSGVGPLAGTLEGAREALLRRLAEKLSASQRRRTTIVFDAAGAPPGLPDRYACDGIDVRFARGFADADAMIEHLLEHWPGPKGLTVVSSDHRVQRAARGRGAKYTDSGLWYAELLRRRKGGESATQRPAAPLEPPEYWVEQFSDQQLLDEIARHDAAAAAAKPSPGSGDVASAQPAATPAGPSTPEDPGPAARQPFGEGIFDPFPPGYASDLAREFEGTPPPTSKSAAGPGKRPPRGGDSAPRG